MVDPPSPDSQRPVLSPDSQRPEPEAAVASDEGTGTDADAASSAAQRSDEPAEPAARGASAAGDAGRRSSGAGVSAFATPRESSTSGQPFYAGTPVSPDVYEDARSSPSSSADPSADGGVAEAMPQAAAPPPRPTTAPAAALPALAARQKAFVVASAAQPGAGGVAAAGQPAAAEAEALERPQTAPSTGSSAGGRPWGGGGAAKAQALLRLKQRSAVRRSTSTLSVTCVSDPVPMFRPRRKSWTEPLRKNAVCSCHLLFAMSIRLASPVSVMLLSCSRHLSCREHKSDID